MQNGNNVLGVLKWLLLFLAPLLLHATDEQGAWSNQVKGLQARLLISPLRKEGSVPRYDVSFQLQRSTSGELMQIDYSPERLVLHVIDQGGKELPSFMGAGNEFVSPWVPLILPSKGFLSFLIADGGGTDFGTTPGKDLYFSLDRQWKIPPPDSTIYYLSGTFTVPARPRDFSSPTWYWSGTLSLPKVEIPRVPQGE